MPSDTSRRQQTPSDCSTHRLLDEAVLRQQQQEPRLRKRRDGKDGGDRFRVRDRQQLVHEHAARGARALGHLAGDWDRLAEVEGSRGLEGDWGDQETLEGDGGDQENFELSGTQATAMKRCNHKHSKAIVCHREATESHRKPTRKPSKVLGSHQKPSGSHWKPNRKPTRKSSEAIGGAQALSLWHLVRGQSIGNARV